MIILNISKLLVVIRFYRFAKWQCIFCHQWQKFCWAILHIELFPQIRLNPSSNVNTVEWLVSMTAVRVFIGSALTLTFGLASRDYTFGRSASYVLFQNV